MSFTPTQQRRMTQTILLTGAAALAIGLGYSNASAQDLAQNEFMQELGIDEQAQAASDSEAEVVAPQAETTEAETPQEGVVEDIIVMPSEEGMTEPSDASEGSPEDAGLPVQPDPLQADAEMDDVLKRINEDPTGDSPAAITESAASEDVFLDATQPVSTENMTGAVSADEAAATPAAEIINNDILVPQNTQEAAPSDASVPVDAAQAPSESSDLAADVTPVPAIPAQPVVTAEDENVFFDAEALVPRGEMASKGGPRKVDPSLQPASRFVIVETDASAGSKGAGLVSAERAMKLGRYSSALQLYDTLYADNGSDPNVLLGRAVALQKLGREDEAINAYEELLEIRPENVDAQVNMLGLVGNRYPQVALKRLSDLLEANRDNVGIIAQMAIISANIGQYNEALQYLGMAAGIEPRNAAHLYNMAVIADRAGDKANALTYYEKALETDTIYGGGRTVPRDAIFERLAKLR